MKIAHMIVPVAVPPEHELSVAQPITFESMNRAREYASGRVDVDLLACHLPQEDLPTPPGFQAVPALERTVLDLRPFRVPRKLALLKDILQRLYAASDGADYCMYSNVDIGLQPDFYVQVEALATQGFDAFTINRRTISDRYTSADQLPEMYDDPGTPHPGYDCFVFRRALMPQFIVNNVCLGTGQVDTPLVCSMITYAKRFKEIADQKLTFHVGDSRQWQRLRLSDYFLHNCREATAALTALLTSTDKQHSLRWLPALALSLKLPKNTILIPEWIRLFQSG